MIGQGEIVLENVWHPCLINDNELMEDNIEMMNGIYITLKYIMCRNLKNYQMSTSLPALMIVVYEFM